MIKRKYTCTDGLWEVTITNGNRDLNVKISGMESKAIAVVQARDRIRELRKVGIIKS
jgi:hypothetical protein